MGPPSRIAVWMSVGVLYEWTAVALNFLGVDPSEQVLGQLPVALVVPEV